jgi:hypothetical protein
MIDDIIVIDDIVGQQHQELIKQRLLSAPWYYIDDVAYPNAPDFVFEGSSRQPGFVHWYKSPNGNQTDLFDVVLPIALSACDKIKFNLSNIVEARSFMQLASAVKREYNNVHTDYERPHLVCLYYVLDSDGDTFIFDQTEEDISPRDVNKSDKLTLLKRVTPKQGRVVLFNGSKYHASSDPSLGSRLVVNFVLEGDLRR